jgi:hypothetical protein
LDPAPVVALAGNPLTVNIWQARRGASDAAASVGSADLRALPAGARRR